MRKWILVMIIVLLVLGGALLFALLPDHPPAQQASAPAIVTPLPTPAPVQTPPAGVKAEPTTNLDDDIHAESEDIDTIRQEMINDMKEELREAQKLQQQDDHEDAEWPVDPKPAPKPTGALPPAEE